MKKYIRTKDGIYEVTKEQILCGVKFYDFEQDDCPNRIRAEFVKEADTIEELCDCFVVVGKKHIVWDKAQIKGLTFGQVKFAFANEDFEIYGAIWTDKGLIYVAKMNDEGKLCLI